MSKNDYTELRVVGWIKRNMHVTTLSLSEKDLQMWEALFLENRERAMGLAAYGYRLRQSALYGQDTFTDDELIEFVQEFEYKLQVAREGDDGLKLPLFEYSVRNLRKSA